jgi:hypothetical protein
VIGGLPQECRQDAFETRQRKTDSDQAELSNETGFDSSLPARFNACGPQLPKRFVLSQKQKRSCAAHVLMLSFASGARSGRSARFVPSEEQLLFQIVNVNKTCVAQAAMSGRSGFGLKSLFF